RGSLSEEHHAIGHSVGPKNLACESADLSLLQRVHPPCSGAAGKKGKNARPATEVHDDVAGLHRLADGPVECVEPRMVLEHGLVVLEEAIAALHAFVGANQGAEMEGAACSRSPNPRSAVVRAKRSRSRSALSASYVVANCSSTWRRGARRPMARQTAAPTSSRSNMAPLRRSRSASPSS